MPSSRQLFRQSGQNLYRRALLPNFPASANSTDGLALLRANALTRGRESDQPEQLTPAFLFFTFVAAMVVFWVSGGHALLY